MARQLHQSGDLDHRVRVGVGLAVTLLQGCDHAGITVAEDGETAVGVGSDDLPARAGVIQHEVGHGPRVDGSRPQNRSVFVVDLGVDPRGPQWATRMREELGVHAVLSLLLYTHDQPVGVLNLYADLVGAFNVEDLVLAPSLATHHWASPILQPPVLTDACSERAHSGVRRRCSLGVLKTVSVVDFRATQPGESLVAVTKDSETVAHEPAKSRFRCPQDAALADKWRCSRGG